MTTLQRQRANPVELSQHLPGKKLHLKSIATGLNHIRPGLVSAIHALPYFFSGESSMYDSHTVSKMLTSSTVLLEGLLDGLVICALSEDRPIMRNMNFKRTPFIDQRLLVIQEQVKGLRSFSESNKKTYADFWTLADFWKHYLPCVPYPKMFPGQKVDFQIELGSGKSGPVLHDLIIPTFNKACEIVEIIGLQLGMIEEDWFVKRIS